MRACLAHAGSDDHSARLVTNTGYAMWTAFHDCVGLPCNTLHVWVGSLDDPSHRLEAVEGLLSPDERARADRFRFERDRRRFMIGRALLRTVLGSHLKRPPGAIEFAYAAHGKPGLADECEPCRFNISHSADLAVIAVQHGGTLGIDVEHIRALPDADAIAARFFAESEVTSLDALPPAARLEAFFACWTRKEAYLKALGDGLSIPLKSFAVSCEPDEAPRIIRAAGDTDACNRWHVLAFKPARAFVAAVVVDSAPFTSHFRRAPLIR